MNKIKKYYIIYFLPALPAFIWCFYNNTGLTVTAANIFRFTIFAPISEELIFRSLQEHLLIKKVHPIHANLATAALFALCHLIIRRDPFTLLTFFPAIAIGLCYQRTRSIPPAILLHAVYNLSIFNFKAF